MIPALVEHPHRRHNPLTGEWVQVSPQRTRRPWQGQVDAVPSEMRPSYDPSCYLCPGNRRASGRTNPAYGSTYVFDNDFAALLADHPGPAAPDHALLRSAAVQGECRVICFSPRHDLTLARMDVDAIRRVVDIWAQQVEELGQRYQWVQIFENKGELMGCSNPHPHSQVWALDTLPNEPRKEAASQAAYFADHGRSLLLDYAHLEIEREERVVALTEGWVAVVPFWAVWPYEVLLIPRRQVAQLPELVDDERADLALILRRLLRLYDRLFDTSFPYSMGWHGQPCLGGGDGWQVHAHFYPPLLRSATVRKFMVGYEMLCEAQRDLTAEAAAAHLRSLAESE